MKYRDEIAKVNARATELGIEMTSLGNPKAPVMFVGFEHEKGQKIPFSTAPTSVLAETLQKMQIRPELVYMTNLVRLPDDYGKGPFWKDLLLGEVNENTPRAVILQGLDTARVVLESRAKNIQDLRFARYVFTGRCKSTFFVTHDLYDVIAPGGLTQLGVEWLEDIRAVFDSNQNYYPVIRPVGGFRAEGQ